MFKDVNFVKIAINVLLVAITNGWWLVALLIAYLIKSDK